MGLRRQHETDSRQLHTITSNKGCHHIKADLYFVNNIWCYIFTWIYVVVWLHIPIGKLDLVVLNIKFWWINTYVWFLYNYSNIPKRDFNVYLVTIRYNGICVCLWMILAIRGVNIVFLGNICFIHVNLKHRLIQKNGTRYKNVYTLIT